MLSVILSIQHKESSMSENIRQHLLDSFKIASETAHPKKCLSHFLPALDHQNQTFILGAGKATSAMVVALEEHYENKGQAHLLQGIAVTRHGYSLPTKYIELKEAGHPVPDNNSTLAAQNALNFARKAKPEDTIIVLLSGGASALWSAPIEGISLPEKQHLTKQLLQSGATIDQINCVRKHLSRIKGGKLAKAAGETTLHTFAISDVPHDDIASIGSGPTVGDPTTCSDARNILQTFNIQLPSEIISLLDREENETPSPSEMRDIEANYHLIATPQKSLEAAATYFQNIGYETKILGDSIEGEARQVAQQHADEALIAKQKDQRLALISGGELTVTIKGHGKGGPNQEYALALAIALKGSKGINALAGDTDGSDGGAGGINDPAGAIISPETPLKAQKNNIDALKYLENNDSGGFFEKIGDLLVTGPTQTNVNDYRVILIDP